jgi:hypothetical protein
MKNMLWMMEEVDVKETLILSYTYGIESLLCLCFFMCLSHPFSISFSLFIFSSIFLSFFLSFNSHYLSLSIFVQLFFFCLSVYLFNSFITNNNNVLKSHFNKKNIL